MLLIKNDPKYNEQWPRALVPYKRIYGVDEPQRLPPLANDGKLSPHLPEGTPFGLVGTSSLYKRESLPQRRRPARQRDGDVSRSDKDPDRLSRASTRRSTGSTRAPTPACTPTTTSTPSASCRWSRRPTAKGPRAFYNHARERLRILGEIPVRKFDTATSQPLDPDGNPDTSFLAKIPADVAFTFQTLDKHGMVLNMAQTWHQVRPGEIRNDCGGCHAHSQKPTVFKHTAAAQRRLQGLRPDNAHAAADDESQRSRSGQKWDANDETGLRFAEGRRTSSTTATSSRSSSAAASPATPRRHGRSPAGNLVLDDDTPVKTWQNPAGLGFDHHGARHLRPPGRRPGGQVRAQAAWQPCVDWRTANARRATSA